MRKPVVAAFVVAVFLLGLSLYATQQPESAADESFDPRDLTGIWSLDPRPEAGRTISANRPPMTEWGLERFDAVRSSRDDPPWTNSHSPASQSEWNDPVDWCDPIGYPRVMWEPQTRLMRFVQTPKVLLQMWEWHRNWRDIWLDGRDLLEDPEPRYYGYGVGRWEGDTLVVESNGFNDRAWHDPYGSPRSEETRLLERFHRVSHDKMEWTLTVTDPKTYTEPWESGPMTLTLIPKSTRSPYEELREDICVWSDQSYFYTGVDSTGVGDLPVQLPTNR